MGNCKFTPVQPPISIDENLVIETIEPKTLNQIVVA